MGRQIVGRVDRAIGGERPARRGQAEKMAAGRESEDADPARIDAVRDRPLPDQAQGALRILKRCRGPSRQPSRGRR
ncbi:hypothetical protein ASF18_17520 [Methylobacterium sp. Leaf89]|nr:hypothetical protein ASF18_17520 [Methylobacterium sp. Leaf89]